MFLLDCGRRLHTRDGERSHFDAALDAILLAAHVALRQGDAVGLMTFSGERRWLAPRKGVAQANALLDSVYDLTSGARAADYTAAARDLMASVRKRALVIVVSNVRDEDIDELRSSLRLLSRRHLVLLASLREAALGEALAQPIGDLDAALRVASIRLYRDGTLYQIPIRDFYNRPELQRTRLLDGDAIYVDTSYDLERALTFYQQKINVLSLRNQARAQALTELSTQIGLRRAALDEQRSNFEARAELGAEKRDYVYLAGEVNNQSRFALPYAQQANLADVLYDNGGFSTQTANPAHIYVLRASSNPADFGAVTAWHLNAGNAANITIATQMEMRPNDVVFIE
ncbi:MAG: hypothetical protein ABGW95_01065, partial [Candidatus Poseidoniia archaeon]